MQPKVTVVDYGMGNMFSVRRALEHCGAAVETTTDADCILAAERLVLPGVGAFADGMEGLRSRGLVKPLLEYASSHRPFLGICLGMQMLMSISEEFGKHQGLGLIPGRVIAIPSTGPRGAIRKIPHVGWSELVVPPTLPNWESTILADVPPRGAVYFVHSYAALPEDETHRLADTEYEGARICAAIRREAVHGCQFHPEKSGPVGLGILRRFVALK
jgi:glutamine amidotransferase